MQPIYRQLFGFETGEYPVSENVSKECLSLPMHPFLCEEDVEYVCEMVKKFYMSS